MEHNNNNNGSYGASWADQWDVYNPDPVVVPPKNKKKSSVGSVGDSKYAKKVGEGFDKSKAVASTGFKKMKEGTTLGFNWVKDKYRKRTQKH
ncbi:hypothetical protein Syun_023957 [Stephania yunnanensis]|uniref:CDP-diacylglycerol-glycerol-3-phosphate 3-phosphatidyltransferase n=1 Tax=Stephania yunnanensis TaxID=152371 RepID=A0AAP0F9Z0_9MAGN